MSDTEADTSPPRQNARCCCRPGSLCPEALRLAAIATNAYAVAFHTRDEAAWDAYRAAWAACEAHLKGSG